MFYDFHIRDNRELVLEAERLGYNGVAVYKKGENSNNNFNKELISPDVSESSFKILYGLIIYSRNLMDLKRKIQKFRREADILMVHGGDLKINRAACENHRVDILSNPYSGRRDCGINHISARKAAENNVAIELNLKYLLKTKPKLRYKVLGYYRELLKLFRKYNFPLIITSDAHSNFDMHTPHDIIALTNCFGMDEDEAITALSETPLSIIERNYPKNKLIIEGARIVY